MSGTPRLLLVALVFLNLAFVHITESADWLWLGPLMGLTLASPLLMALRRHRVYRWAWNGAVLVVFAQLVQHSTGAGVHYLLEDGLLLAALCQVHLLNNIGPDQKPDLLLFNSFLIAVVVSFLCLELAYFVVFLVYAPVLVLTMQVLAAPEIAARPGRLLRHGLPKALVAVAVTLLVFFFLPRDFRRRGMLGDRIRFLSPGASREVDFSEEVDLGQTGKVRTSDRVVMKVRVERGDPRFAPTYWRGKCFDRFDGTRWRRTAIANRFHRRRPPRPVGQLRVRLLDPEADRLFLPLERTGIIPPAIRGIAQMAPRPDGTMPLPRGMRAGGDLAYTVLIASDGLHAAVPRRLASYTMVPPEVAVGPSRVLARRLIASLPPNAPHEEIVERMRHHLANRFRYVLPGEDDAARSLDEFIGGESGGHCEYFATALSVMLRSEGIPCRLVAGYRSEEWNDAHTLLTIRARHAHAWVEVLDPERGWYTVDPTPAAPWGDGGDGDGLLDRIGAVFSWVWRKITDFDSEDRDRAFAWLAAAPGRIRTAFVDDPLPFVIGAAVLVGLILVRRRWGRRRDDPAVAAYRRSLRRAGLVRRTGETPREALGRAREISLPPRRFRRVEEATERHERARYLSHRSD